MCIATSPFIFRETNDYIITYVIVFPPWLSYAIYMGQTAATFFTFSFYPGFLIRMFTLDASTASPNVTRVY